ncbi:hypothetical protein PIB30_091823, partial [Stylosanthes scabra]|nr:hypothetical protein [Stylosanthes scabra]
DEMRTTTAGRKTAASTQASAIEFTKDDRGYSSELRWNLGDGEGASGSTTSWSGQNGGSEVVGSLEGMMARGEWVEVRVDGLGH